MAKGRIKSRKMTDVPIAFGQTEKPETVLKNAAMPEEVRNGLCEALGYSGNPFGGLGVPGTPQGGGSPEQLSDTTTLFTNLRWYLVTNFRNLLNQLYVEIGLIRTVVDIPVDDAMRGGVTIKSQQLDEDQIKQLKNHMDREDDLGTAGQACKWTRLFGGGGIIIMVDDQDPETPLDIAKIGKGTEVTFKAVDLWELYWDKQFMEGFEADNIDEDFEFYDYYSSRVHKSRVLRLKGITPPSFIRPRLRGWGISVVEILVRSINQYLKASDLSFEVLDEFKIDVYKIKNLVTTLLNPNGQQKIQQRVQLANWQKNYQNAVVMDSEDDWDHKQLSFTGLAEAQAGIRKQVACEMRMPITKLFGSSDSANSMGTADQNDMENYNSMVENEVRSKIKFDILKLVEIKCQMLFGFIPDDLEIEFAPLRILTAEQEENVKEKKFNRLLAAKAAGEITTLEFRDACNKGRLFDVILDTTDAAITEVEAQVEDIAGASEADESGNSPGADRQDTQSAKPRKNSLIRLLLKNAGWDESKHPRAPDGQFGAGGGGPASDGDGGAAKMKAEIERLREEAEKAGDQGLSHKQRELQAKADALEKGIAAPAAKPKKAKKTVSQMTIGELKKVKEIYRKRSSELVDQLIDAGFGEVKPTEMRKRVAENPLFAEYLAVSDVLQDISHEATVRGGPNVSLEMLDPRVHKPTKNEIKCWRKAS